MIKTQVFLMKLSISVPQGEACPAVFLCLFAVGSVSLRFFYVLFKEVIYMTLNIFLFTITIQKRETSFEELIQNEKAKKFYEENKQKVTHYTQW